jgi:hypothetical protein
MRETDKDNHFSICDSDNITPSTVFLFNFVATNSIGEWALERNASPTRLTLVLLKFNVFCFLYFILGKHVFRKRS